MKKSTTPARKRIFERLGRLSAEQIRAITYDKYKNDIRGFLAAIVQPGGWVEKTQYNKGAGHDPHIRPIEKLYVSSCRRGTDAVGSVRMHAGMAETDVFGHPGKPTVEATLEESILRGSTRCVFRIQVL